MRNLSSAPNGAGLSLNTRKQGNRSMRGSPHRTRTDKSSSPSEHAPKKITYPRANRLYPRERLFAILDGIRGEHAAVWISSPGGAGKTSLVASYLAARRLPALWYQVDSGDGDIASFFYYLSLAAQSVAPGYKNPLPAPPPEHFAPLPAFARRYFRDLYRRLPEGCAVILDNYQEAPEDAALHDVLQIAIEEVPQGLTLMVLSRVAPPATLARLRLCEHAACLDWEYLRLTAEESAGVSAMRLGAAQLGDATLRKLHEHSHGWVAGLVLMLEQLRANRGFDPGRALGDRKLLCDFFANEIFSRASAATQDFLLKTALFSRLDVAAVREFTGNDHAHAILEDLTRHNFFTVRHGGATENSYEYHPLLREFLLTRLAMQMSASEIRVLRRRAAALLVETGHVDNAADLLIAAGAWDALIRLILQQASSHISQGRSLVVAQWISAIPEETRDGIPWLGYWFGVCRLPCAPVGARHVLERVYARFTEMNDLSGRYLAWCAIVDTFVFEWGNFTPVLRWLEESERLQASPPPNEQIAQRFAAAMFMAQMNARPQREFMAPWERHALNVVLNHPSLELRAMVGNHLILYKTWITGDLNTAETIMRTLRPLVASPGSSVLVKTTFSAMASAYLWQTGDADNCLQEVEGALALGKESGIHLWDALLCTHALFALMTNNRWHEAQVYIDRFEALSVHARPLERAMFHYFRAWHALVHDAPDTAVHHSEAATEMAKVAGAPYPHAMMQLAWSVSLFHAGAREQAKSLLEATRAAHQSMESRPGEYLVALTVAEFALMEQRQDDCVVALQRALPIGRACNVRTHTWWRGPLMARLYALALEHGIETDYVRSVIRQRKLQPPTGFPIADTWPYPIKIFTLGRFSLLKDGQPVVFAGRTQKKTLDLLKAIIALGGREVDEHRLGDLLWPDAEADEARANLKTTLHRLRALIGQEAIRLREGKLTLDAHHCWVDVWGFERLANTLLSTGESLPATEMSRLGAQLRIYYRGPFLGEEQSTYVLAARERLGGKWLRAIALIADCAQNEGNTDQALAWYEHGLAFEPLAEPLYLGYLRLCKATQRSAEGVALYERMRRILAAQLQVAPSPAVVALALALRNVTG